MDGIFNLDLELSKFVNFTTQTITTQGRQVGVIFAPQIKSIQFHLQQLQSLIKEAHNIIQGLLEKMKSFDSFLSRIRIQIEIFTEIPELEMKLKSLEEQKVKLEKTLAENEAHLKKLVGSEEFKRSEAIEREIQTLELEKSQVKNAISTTFSGLDRPLRKMEKLIADGKVQIDRDVLKVLQPCLHDPVAVVMSDEKLANAKKLCQQMLKSIDSGDISLNDREKAKREEILTEIINGKELEESKKSLEDLKENLNALLLEKSKFTISKQISDLERVTDGNRSALKNTLATFEEYSKKLKVLQQESEKGIVEIEKSAHEVTGSQIKLTF